MASKAERLKRRSLETVRTAKPGRLAAAEGRSKRGYKVVAVSLYTDQADSIEQTAKNLEKAGYPKANRSLVVQTAIERLARELEGKNPEETLQFFAKANAPAHPDNERDPLPWRRLRQDLPG